MTNGFFPFPAELRGDELTQHVERPVLCIGPCRPLRDDGTGGPRRTMHGSALCEVCAERFSDNLHAIADDWDALEQRVAREDARGVGDEKVKGSRLQYGISLNEAVVATRAEVAGWMYFVARIVLENPSASGPEDQSTPGLARWIADWYCSAIVCHEDIELVAALTAEARDHARSVARRAYPSDSRRVDLRQQKCAVLVVVDHGREQPCGGHYFAIVNPAAIDRADLICTENSEHRIPPSQWARKQLLQPLDGMGDTSWLTSKEAAAKIGTTIDNVYNLAARDGWDKRVSGRTARYSERDVNRTIAARDDKSGTVSASA